MHGRSAAGWVVLRVQQGAAGAKNGIHRGRTLFIAAAIGGRGLFFELLVAKRNPTAGYKRRGDGIRMKIPHRRHRDPVWVGRHHREKNQLTYYCVIGRDGSLPRSSGAWGPTELCARCDPNSQPSVPVTKVFCTLVWEDCLEFPGNEIPSRLAIVTKEERGCVCTGLPNGIGANCKNVIAREFCELLYVDRLVVGARDIPRSIPIVGMGDNGVVKTRDGKEGWLPQGFGHGMGFREGNDNIEASKLRRRRLYTNTPHRHAQFSLGLTQDSRERPMLGNGQRQDVITLHLHRCRENANTGGMASPRGVTTPSSQIDIHAQQSRPIQQPRSQCLAPQRNDIQDPKGKRPLMQDPRPFCMYFSPHWGTPPCHSRQSTLYGCDLQMPERRPRKMQREGVPTRLFATTATTIGTVVDVATHRNDRVKWFEKRLDQDLQSTNHVGTATLDMGHYYVINVNFKHHRLDILDNSSVRTSNGGKYQDAPMELHNSDSGVFAMRHMESLTGQDHNNCQCGLQTGNAHQITNLRKRIMHNVLLAEINLHTQAITNRVAQSLNPAERLNRTHITPNVAVTGAGSTRRKFLPQLM
nr:uncharacterized protein LOC109168291 [Ipomoea batatas]